VRLFLPFNSRLVQGDAHDTCYEALLIAAGALSVSAGALAVSATSSSAAVVCNRDGDCWRVHGRPSYGSDLGLRIYGDNWRWRRGDNYRWRKVGRGSRSTRLA
jgi:hypothetical protein